ncbi:MAG TPA: hypothetical protein DD740_02695 [Chryseobacterium sp.]|nr:hypothetical protein HER18_12945 [Chryseobacterium sp. NEB161]HBR11121.1 hypothetical protein [Chryseobacterium sp.]
MEFYNIILHAHKGFAYLELALVAAFLILLLVTMFGYSGNVSKALRKVTLFTMIFFHIQFLIGLVMLFVSPGVKAAISSGTLMSDAYARFQYVEHPSSMLIAAVLMTILNKKIKTNDKITIPVVSLGLVAVALFVFAFPWSRVFG